MPIQPELLAYGPRVTPTRPFRLSPEEEESYLAKLARQGGGAIEVLGKVLDYPAAIARGVLAGDPYSGFSWDLDRRVSGSELLEQYGLLPQDANPWVKAGAGLAAEIALDPLTMISGPLRALNPAGKAAKAAGILDKASDAAMARVGFDEAAKTFTGKATRAWAERLAPQGLAATPETFAIRPLIGQRQAQISTTLDELVQFVNKQRGNTEAMDAVNAYLAKKGLKYQDVAQQKLGGAFGLGYFSPLATFTPPGSQSVLDVMDRVGQGIAWSYPSRKMSQFFDKRVNDMANAADQVESLKHSRYLDDAAKESRRLAARHAMTVSDIQLSPQAQNLLGSKTLFSPQGNDFLTRLFENTYTKSDDILRQAIGPDIDKAIASWDAIRKHNVMHGQALGLEIEPYSDMWKVLYSPRKAAEADFGEYATGLSQSPYNTRMLEQEARQDYLKTPGGTMDLREVSMLPKVRELIKNGTESKHTIGEVGKEIADFLNSKHAGGKSRVVGSPTTYAVGQDQGEAIAKFMQRFDKRLPDDLPVFSEHPLTAQARNIVGQGAARANARFIYDTLAEHAVNKASSAMPGGFKSIPSALNDIARATGMQMDAGNASAIVRANMADSIAKRLGKNIDEINLDEFTIPETVYNRLTRIQSFYSSPRAQQEFLDGFNKYTNLFKGFVLAWPSRFVRDMYSNLFSVMLENGSVTDTIYGMGTAKKILAGRMDEAVAALKQLPQYAKITDPNALRRAFIEDAAGSGVLQTLASSDLLTANRSGDIAQLVPGSTPISKMDAAKELFGGDYSQFFQIKDIQMPWQKAAAYETKNPILNASQKMSDYVDSVGRLGGYISLLRQGVTPAEAARRMTSALVDYSSLTPLERGTFRAFFPWWAYNSRIGKYVVQHLANNPGGGYAQTIRALNTLQTPDKDTYIPEALRQSFAVRVPDALKPYLGIDQDSENTTFFRDIDLPGVDVLSLFSPQRSIGRSLQQTAFNVLNQANPAIRGAAELATNEDFFSRRPLEQAITPLDRVYMRASGSQYPLNPWIRTGLNAMPGLQRPIGLAAGLMDDRIPMQQRVAKQLFNTFTGVKIQDVDPEWMINDQRRAIANDLHGWTRTRVTNFVPKESIQFMPPALQMAVGVDKSLEKKATKLNEEKRKRREALMRGVK